MLGDKMQLDQIVNRIEVGLVNREDIIVLRGLIERLDEMDDLVDTVCSCRTQEIPVLRGLIQKKWDDDAPGRP